MLTSLIFSTTSVIQVVSVSFLAERPILHNTVDSIAWQIHGHF